MRTVLSILIGAILALLIIQVSGQGLPPAPPPPAPEMPSMVTVRFLTTDDLTSGEWEVLDTYRTYAPSRYFKITIEQES